MVLTVAQAKAIPATNGVNPDGEIQKTVLAAAPTAQDQAHVSAMSATSVDPAELAAFAKEGNLSTPK